MLAIWFTGAALMLLTWWLRWKRVANVARQASALEHGRELSALRRLEQISGITRPLPMLASTSSLEPGVFGILKPVLLWPRSIGERLADRQIDAILAHEVAHVRRRDNLVAAVHMVVQCVFWFHPLVWWIGARLVDERERACDEDVIRMGSEPQVYAESILRTCEFCLEAPLVCVAGVTGSDLKKRIEAIMRGPTSVALDAWKKLLLGAAGFAAIAGPVAAGMLNAPPLRAEIRAVVQTRQSTQDSGAPGRSGAESGPKFEVASVKVNKSGDTSIRMQALPGGRINVDNATLRLLIRNAYTVQDFQISGGPDWINSDRFDVVATSTGNPTQPEIQMMLRRLLADRFKLTVHSETRELPVYALTLARSDRRLGPRLRSAEPCFRSPADGPPQQPPLLGPGPCGFRIAIGRSTAKGVTMGAFAASLSNSVGRTVQDRTDLSGNFDLELEFTPDQTLNRPPGGQDAPAPAAEGASIFTAVQEQLGLKLESQRGPVEVLVIDRVERPTPD
jgi:uncharacterized protein (TIGR03435 family)